MCGQKICSNPRERGRTNEHERKSASTADKALLRLQRERFLTKYARFVLGVLMVYSTTAPLHRSTPNPTGRWSDS